MKTFFKINVLILFFVLIANISYANDELIVEKMLSEYAESFNPITEEIQEQTEFTVFTKNSNQTYSITANDIRENNLKKYGEDASRNFTSYYTPIRNNGIESNLMLANDPPTYMFNRMNLETRLCRIVVNGLDTGTGFLVGPNLMITAAHVVYDENNNVNGIDIYPGYDYGPYNNNYDYKSGWQQIYAYPVWLENHDNRAYDLAVIELDWNMGDTFGWFGCQSYGTNQEMNNLSIKEYGYPALLDLGKRQYYTSGNIFNTHDTYFHSSAVNYEGMSGGPIVRTSDNYAVGIVSSLITPTSGNTTTYSTYGRRITQDIIDLVNSLN